MSKDLVEALRERARMEGDAGLAMTADEIERLRAKVAELEHEIGHMGADLIKTLRVLGLPLDTDTSLVPERVEQALAAAREAGE